jgi:hypothetical protein
MQGISSAVRLWASHKRSLHGRQPSAGSEVRMYLLVAQILETVTEEHEKLVE